MTTTKSKPLASYATLFKALADATRLEMLEILAAKSEALCACEIEDHFPLSQPTISHHLRLLREAGLVTAERRGTWVYFTLDLRALDALKEFRQALRE